MKNQYLVLSIACAGFATGLAHSDYTVHMNMIDTTGVGAAIGDVVIKDDGKGGVTFTPKLKGLSPGEHGFHVHQFPNCGAKEKDGKIEPGDAAGPHWDPDKAAKHGSPAGGGHRGDVPPLVVAADGTARTAVTAPRIKYSELNGKALMIHQGGDNFSDQPKPNGGGGTRIACGVIAATTK